MTSNLICHFQCQDDGTKIEYRAWNPFRSKLAAAILGGVEAIHMQPGSKVLYLGAASGTTVSHVSDIVGPVSVPFILANGQVVLICYTCVQISFFFAEMSRVLPIIILKLAATLFTSLYFRTL